MNKNNKLEYLTQCYEKDKDYFNHDNSKIKTGFNVIDSNMQIRRGVYLLGGLPSVGKTTLALQLADNIAQSGNAVLFFSLEQSEYDLTSKSINRIKSNNDISESDAILSYSKYAENITTITSQTFITIDDVENVVSDYMKESKNNPVVLIDYLQLIKYKDNLSKKESVSIILNRLVNISKTHNLVMFILSSLNRANYMSPIDFESFKESGSIEYDADVIFGLQYQIIESDLFMNCSSIEKKRKMIAEEKEKEKRAVELICLKNRFGKIIPKCRFDYYTNYDLFVETERQSQPKRISKCF